MFFWKNKGGLSIVPLGGASYIGHNCFLYKSGDSAVVVDCGIKPQTHEESKINPRDSWAGDPPPRLDILDDLLKKGVNVVGVITHAHWDHIGAILELIKRGIPVYLSRDSKLFAERYAENLRITAEAKFHTFDGNKTLKHGDLEISFIPLPHSIPGTHGVLIRRGDGKNILHLTDWKFNGMHDSIEEIRKLLQEIRSKAGDKIHCLTIDVLNVEMGGFTPPEQLVLDSVGKIVQEAKGRVIITFFASNLDRMRGIIDIAEFQCQTVGVAGWGMKTSYGMLGKKFWPAQNGSILLIGGSQGEENSALARMARGEHQFLRISPRDTFVGLFRSIPGNEEAIRMTLSDINNAGAMIFLHQGEAKKLNLPFKAQEALLHVSGHSQWGDLSETVKILDPEIILPIHALEEKRIMFENFVGKNRVRRLQAGETLEI